MTAVVIERSATDRVGWELALLELLSESDASGVDADELVRRWLAKVQLGPELPTDVWPSLDGEPCWLWTGATNERGYGRMRGGRSSMLYAHRVGFALAGFRLPPAHVDLELDHLCRVRSCVRASHLELVTHAENIRRHYGAQTTCLRGHPRTPENVRRDALGRITNCLVCRREKRRSGEWS